MRLKTIILMLLFSLVVDFSAVSIAETKSDDILTKIILPLASQDDYKYKFPTAVVPDFSKLYSFPGSSISTIRQTSGQSLNGQSPTESDPKKCSLLVRLANSFLYTPYRWGGTGPRGFDCTGFVYYLYKKIGMPVPRTIGSMLNRGEPVSKNQLNIGDILFFINTYRRGLSHVGIYLGKNKFIHSSSHGRGVRIDSINSSYFINRFFGARRIIR